MNWKRFPVRREPRQKWPRGPLQSTRALRLHRPLRGRHVLHRICAKPACARTGAQQRPRGEVHRGPAAGPAGVSGSVPVCGEGAGTGVRGEATYSRAEERVGRSRETTPGLKPLRDHSPRLHRGGARSFRKVTVPSAIIPNHSEARPVRRANFSNKTRHFRSRCLTRRQSPTRFATLRWDRCGGRVGQDPAKRGHRRVA